MTQLAQIGISIYLSIYLSIWLSLVYLGITTETNEQEELTTSDRDEFDMFAQSRIAYSTGGSTYDDIMHQGQGISISSALHRQPQPPPPTDSR